MDKKKNLLEQLQDYQMNNPKGQLYKANQAFLARLDEHIKLNGLDPENLQLKGLINLL